MRRSNKRPIPAYIRRLGVVTAPNGSGHPGYPQYCGAQNPYVQIILYPALVQGEGAASSIVRGIEALDELGGGRDHCGKRRRLHGRSVGLQ